MEETLADKITGILGARPIIFDPEEDAFDDTAARVVANEDAISTQEFPLSEFRKKVRALPDEADDRYVGKTSIRSIVEANSESEQDATESEHDNTESEHDDTESEDDADDKDYIENEDADKNCIENNPQEDDDIVNAQIFKTSKSAMQQLHVRHQLNAWESLVEIRIQLQKCLQASNTLPKSSYFQDIQAKSTDFNKIVGETTNVMKDLLNKLLNLQMYSLKTYSATKDILSKKNQTNDESDMQTPSESDTENSTKPLRKRMKVNEYNDRLRDRFDSYYTYRNSLLEKWHNKTKIVSNQTDVNYSITQEINDTLGKKEELIRATQLKCTDHKPDPQNSDSDGDLYNTNTYDDADFYLQLLREYIKFKTDYEIDPVKIQQQSVFLRKLRNKMKKKVHTKETKGRKLKYAIHSKLVKFMEPIEDVSWQGPVDSEFLNSLFGKNVSS